eukprot:CAMPEP_0119469112 /NCGR_PEP_ID=MMETSP1344-20130328/2578_1 /TAXON_ID=236787 /ORGANISM="Florenciella parvula, Strain CCMP2471" /LENGTH=458 /DNA_ID=CAMNT_0007501655 /DNA_START=150 /DNA_END=1527 /DNA_ORIENTATION=-
MLLADALLGACILIPNDEYETIVAIERDHGVTDVPQLLEHLKSLEVQGSESPKSSGLVEYLTTAASTGHLAAVASASTGLDIPSTPTFKAETKADRADRTTSAMPQPPPTQPPRATLPPRASATTAATATTTTAAAITATAAATAAPTATAMATEVPVATPIPVEYAHAPDLHDAAVSAATAPHAHVGRRQTTGRAQERAHDRMRERMRRLTKLSESALPVAIELERHTVEPRLEITNDSDAHFVYINFPSGSAADARVRLDDSQRLVVDGVKVFSASHAARMELIDEVLARAKLTDVETIDRLTADDLVPVFRDLLKERGLRVVEYEPLTLDLPTDGSVLLDEIMKEEQDARTLLITVPKRPKRSRRPAHRAGMPSQTGGPYRHSNGPFGGYSNGYEYPKGLVGLGGHGGRGGGLTTTPPSTTESKPPTKAAAAPRGTTCHSTAGWCQASGGRGELD